MFCPKCGNKLKDGSKFCAQCGAELGISDTPDNPENADREIENLVNLAKNGDQAAFQTLYEKTNKRNYYVALKMVKSDSDAQDVLQDAYIRIYQHLNQFTYNGEGSFASWTSKIVSNTALNHLRKKQVVLFSDIEGDQEGDITLEIEDEDESRQPELAYDKKETSRIVQELLETLSDEQRVCAMMFYYQEQSVKEIASEIGCSENTVKSRLNYARKNMMSKAEELKKRGILTGILSMAGLFAILRSKEAMAMVHVPSDVFAGVADQIAAGSTSSAVSGTSAAGVAGTSSATAAGVAAGTVGTAIVLKVAVVVMSIVAAIAVGIGAFVVVNRISEDKNETITGQTENSETTSSAASGASAVSGAGVDNNEKPPNTGDPFESFIASNTFLSNSGKEYEVKARIEKRAPDPADDQEYYDVVSPLDMIIPDELKNNPLGYSVDDYDLDGEDELLILTSKWEELDQGDYESYKKPYSVARLKLEMYENNAGKIEKSSEIDDFGDVPLSAGIETWGGSFRCFSYTYKGKAIIAFEEEGSDYHARFSDGWGNWWFAALTYENGEFVPIKGSYVDIDFSGGDESFLCNGRDSMYLGDAASYRISELKRVGIEYLFGDYFDYLGPEKESVMPSEKVEGSKTILYVKNDASKQTTYELRPEDIASKTAVLSAISINGGKEDDNQDADKTLTTFTADDCILDVGKQFGDIKKKFGWKKKDGELFHGGLFQFKTPETELYYSVYAKNWDDSLLNPDKYKSNSDIITNDSTISEISADIKHLIPELQNKKMKSKEFLDFLEEKGCSSIESSISEGPFSMEPDVYYEMRVDFEYEGEKHSFVISLGEKKSNPIEASSGVTLR